MERWFKWCVLGVLVVCQQERYGEGRSSRGRLGRRWLVLRLLCGFGGVGGGGGDQNVEMHISIIQQHTLENNICKLPRLLQLHQETVKCCVFFIHLSYKAKGSRIEHGVA